jgi:hypothetical protein
MDSPASTPDTTVDTSNITLGAVKRRPTKFLVCVDERKESQVALRFACLKARNRNGVVDILHVVEKAEMQSLFRASAKMRNERIEEARLMMDDLSQMAKNITGVEPGIILKEGGIGDTIVKTAEEDDDVNMLVLGVSPGSTRGALVSWLSVQLGEKLLMPIMLVPGNMTDQQMMEIA